MGSWALVRGAGKGGQTWDMRWRSDYNIVINPDDTQVDVSGWVTVENNTGTAYEKANIKLLAGDPKVDYTQQPMGYGPDYYKLVQTAVLFPDAEPELIAKLLGGIHGEPAVGGNQPRWQDDQRGTILTATASDRGTLLLYRPSAGH